MVGFDDGFTAIAHKGQTGNSHNLNGAIKLFLETTTTSRLYHNRGGKRTCYRNA